MGFHASDHVAPSSAGRIDRVGLAACRAVHCAARRAVHSAARRAVRRDVAARRAVRRDVAVRLVRRWGGHLRLVLYSSSEDDQPEDSDASAAAPPPLSTVVIDGTTSVQWNISDPRGGGSIHAKTTNYAKGYTVVVVYTGQLMNTMSSVID